MGGGEWSDLGEVVGDVGEGHLTQVALVAHAQPPVQLTHRGSRARG